MLIPDAHLGNRRPITGQPGNSHLTASILYMGTRSLTLHRYLRADLRRLPLSNPRGHPQARNVLGYPLRVLPRVC